MSEFESGNAFWDGEQWNYRAPVTLPLWPETIASTIYNKVVTEKIKADLSRINPFFRSLVDRS